MMSKQHLSEPNRITSVFVNKLLSVTGKQRGRDFPSDPTLQQRIRRYQTGESAITLNGLVPFLDAIGYELTSIVVSSKHYYDGERDIIEIVVEK